MAQLRRHSGWMRFLEIKKLIVKGLLSILRSTVTKTLCLWWKFIGLSNNAMKIQNIKEYILQYYDERYLFDVIGPRVRERGYMTFDEFYKICMWKSARQKNRYKKNIDRIEELTRKIFAMNIESADEEKRKIQMLCDELEGVGIPTASALLTIVFPDRYAVIDIRCLEVLRNHLHIDIKKTILVNSWIKYLSIMRGLAQENNVTPRDVDMALFAMHKELLDKDNYRNLYKQ